MRAALPINATPSILRQSKFRLRPQRLQFRGSPHEQPAATNWIGLSIGKRCQTRSGLDGSKGNVAAVNVSNSRDDLDQADKNIKSLGFRFRLVLGRGFHLLLFSRCLWPISPLPGMQPRAKARSSIGQTPLPALL